jgi:lipoprotein signal peptidase
MGDGGEGCGAAAVTTRGIVFFLAAVGVAAVLIVALKLILAVLWFVGPAFILGGAVGVVGDRRFIAWRAGRKAKTP